MSLTNETNQCRCGSNEIGKRNAVYFAGNVPVYCNDSWHTPVPQPTNETSVRAELAEIAKRHHLKWEGVPAIRAAMEEAHAAGMARMREMAAEICNQEKQRWDYFNGGCRSAHNCMDAIRALPAAPGAEKDKK